jgi:hypothetical protein
MVCGMNYHGGNQQNGCGEHFDWSKAKQYVSQIVQPRFETRNINTPIELKDHSPYKCDKCHESIMGIRFECVNCECCNYCEKCEEEETLTHENHLFKLFF